MNKQGIVLHILFTGNKTSCLITESAGIYHSFYTSAAVADLLRQ